MTLNMKQVLELFNEILEVETKLSELNSMAAQLFKEARSKSEQLLSMAKEAGMEPEELEIKLKAWMEETDEKFRINGTDFSYDELFSNTTNNDGTEGENTGNESKPN